MTKKILSLILVLTMIFSLSAVSSFAEDPIYDSFIDQAEGETQVTGTITPTVISFTIPTSTTFTLDPNLAEGLRFVTTGFTVTNNATAPLTVSVESFAQKAGAGHLFNDVAKDIYTTEQWNKLGKGDSESKIALGLKTVDPLQWGSLLKTDPLYVTDSIAAGAAVEIGVINPSEAVDFTFEASHGNSFSEEITAEYIISWIFGLA